MTTPDPRGGATDRAGGTGAGAPSEKRATGLRRLRAILTMVAAVVLVVAIALTMRACTKDPAQEGSYLQGSLVSAVTGTTDQLTPGEIATGISVLPATERVQPGAEEWAALLPQLEEAAGAAPDDADAQRALALAYYNLKRLEDAATIYERLLVTAEDAVLRNRLGNTLRDMDDIQGAEGAYRKAISDDPTLAAPYLNLAELLWRRGREGEALAIIDEGLAAVPEESRAALEAGRDVLEDAGD